MNHAVTRNPLLQFGLRYWWAGLILVLIVTLPLTIPHGFLAAAMVLAGAIGLGGGVVGKALWTDRRQALQEAAERESRGERFVCPDCLTFGPVRYGCPQCGHEVDSFLVRNAGRYVNTCEKCGTELPLGARPAALPAHCCACGQNGCAAEWHGSSIRVLGVLNEADFRTLGTAAQAEFGNARGLRFARRQQGRAVTYLLNLADLAGRRDLLPAGHALRQVDEIWIQNGEPLQLVEVLDRFAALAGLDAGALRKIRVSTVESLDPAAERALAARLGNRRNQVLPHAALSGGTA